TARAAARIQPAPHRPVGQRGGDHAGTGRAGAGMGTRADAPALPAGPAGRRRGRPRRGGVHRGGGPPVLPQRRRRRLGEAPPRPRRGPALPGAAGVRPDRTPGRGRAAPDHPRCPAAGGRTVDDVSRRPPGAGAGRRGSVDLAAGSLDEAMALRPRIGGLAVNAALVADGRGGLAALPYLARVLRVTGDRQLRRAVLLRAVERWRSSGPAGAVPARLAEMIR